MCTTLHNDIIVETNNVDNSAGDKKKRPLYIIDYNKFMGSVDRSDQHDQLPQFEQKGYEMVQKSNVSCV